MTTIPLTEHIRDWRTPELQIDAERRLVANVALTGLQSRNGYRYREEALRDAVSLYEGKPVFLDHAANLARPQDRSTRDLVGSIVNPRFEDGRIRGDIQVLDTEAGRTFLALAEADSPAVGMSHVVLAQRSADQSAVERIRDVISVDAVIFPATTQGFRENHHEPTITPLPGSLEALLEEIDARLPDHARRLLDSPSVEAKRVGLFTGRLLCQVHSTEETPCRYLLDWQIDGGRLTLGEQLIPAEDMAPESFQPPATDADVERLRQQVACLLAERDRWQSQQREDERIDRLCQTAGLPASAVSETFRRQLRAAANDELRRELIRDRLEAMHQFRPSKPVSRERLPPVKAANETEAFIAAIRGRSQRHLLLFRS